jgi:hypothetical protein
MRFLLAYFLQFVSLSCCCIVQITAAMWEESSFIMCDLAICDEVEIETSEIVAATQDSTDVPLTVEMT